ncbi:MAG: hypothetical protein J0L82_10300 [Deltaproteobacteria bacterium]|jgi:hypothetical protein|nr:hypothetical protein [Deltaproteobacteria bacterium]
MGLLIKLFIFFYFTVVLGCGNNASDQNVTNDDIGIVPAPITTPLDPTSPSPPTTDPTSGLKNYPTSSGGRYQITNVNVVPIPSTQFYGFATSPDDWAYLMYRRTDSSGVSFMTFERKKRADTSWTRLCSILDDTRFGKSIAVGFPYVYVFDPNYFSGYRIRKVNVSTCLVEANVISIPASYSTPYFNSSYPYFAADGENLWLLEYSPTESQRRVRQFTPQTQAFSNTVSGTISSGVANLGFLRPFSIGANVSTGTRRLWSLSNDFAIGSLLPYGKQAVFSRDMTTNSVRWALLPSEDYPNLSSASSGWPGIAAAQVGFTTSMLTELNGTTEGTPFIVIAAPLNNELHIFWLNVKSF